MLKIRGYTLESLDAQTTSQINYSWMSERGREVSSHPVASSEQPTLRTMALSACGSIFNALTNHSGR